MKKIYDSWDTSYKSTFGAIKTDEFCDFTIKLPLSHESEDAPVMVIYRVGFKKRFIKMNKTAEDNDSISYTASFNTSYSGVYYYYFFTTVAGETYYIKKQNTHIGGFDEGELFQLTVYSADYKTPSFLKGGIMYQIFPDRFCKSGIEHKDIPADRVIRDDWGGTPLYKPHPETGMWNYDYFGGDLEGIISKLPYLQSLGVTCIYMNPIFESHENHRYSTANYKLVDPMLGTNEDFKKLCSEAKAHGISVILDGVFSHTGANSIYFNKYDYYDTVGAYNSKESEYYEWYNFTSYPDVYEAWWGIDSLPNTNENNYKFTQFICDDDGVLHYWLSLGASGFRLDVADELPDTFLYNVRKSMKSVSSEKLVIGEVWKDASNAESYGIKRRYLLGGQLDSVMNYPFRDAILSYIKDGDPEFKNNIMTIIENYPKPATDVLMNFVSTHDVERAISVLGDESIEDKDKEWMSTHKMTPAQYKKGKTLLKLAMVLMYFLPGVPCIYYGDEAGMEGHKDPFNRGCYPWGNEDTELIEFTKQLSSLRKSSSIFKDGTFRFLAFDKDVVGFARIKESQNKAILVFINRSDKVRYIDRKVHKYSKYNIVVGKKEIPTADSDAVKLKLDPYSFAFIKVEA
ncbi:MAG: glycoside hydrolase family 13 protein [Oscillospiraceae bacterium]|nr:glycoside hydrolase family 13 protein [Oscillospiraceae bacterium]